VIRYIGIALAALLSLPAPLLAQEIQIGIGHQSQCTDTYAGGLVVKELRLLERYLPHDGRYKQATYNVQWQDYNSGPPITNMMLANKLQFGVMGDYPLIVNGAKFQETSSQRSLYIAGTGYNLHGEGNGIVVPIHSNIYALEELKGRTVSTPVGSASWGMLLKALQGANLTESVTIVNQSPPVGAANIDAGKIDAHADFCPWPELLEYRGTGRMIYHGSESGVPYLHGIVVRKDFATAYPEIVVAYLKAALAAEQWITQDPVRAATLMQQWSGIPKEVLYLYYGPGGVLTLDSTIKPSFVDTLKYDYQVLRKDNNISTLDFSQWIDDRYVREAYRQMGLDYAKQLQTVIDPARTNAGRPPELWVEGEAIRKYGSVAELLGAVEPLCKAGKAISATYVYDAGSGVKLFGSSAFYVRGADGSVSAFMLRTDAQRFAAKNSGSVVDYSKTLAPSKLATSNPAVLRN
jgi:NitT/TauT family transport system substrate-binding protein